jgi:hypothetical protein
VVVCGAVGGADGLGRLVEKVAPLAALVCWLPRGWLVSGVVEREGGVVGRLGRVGIGFPRT